jgi:hypothetical protein
MDSLTSKCKVKMNTKSVCVSYRNEFIAKFFNQAVILTDGSHFESTPCFKVTLHLMSMLRTGLARQRPTGNTKWSEWCSTPTLTIENISGLHCDSLVYVRMVVADIQFGTPVLKDCYAFP